MYLADSLELLRRRKADSVDLIVTSPPYALIKKKKYGNESQDDYLDWFRPFAEQFLRVLKPTGSCIINIGGAWTPKLPTRSLYLWDVLTMLVRETGFHLCQDFYWHSPSKLIANEWTAIRKIRPLDSVEHVWWLGKTPWPKASARRTAIPAKTPREKVENSGHSLSTMYSPSGQRRVFRTVNEGGSLPSNLLVMSNAAVHHAYRDHCAEKGVPQHPARFPQALPEFFIRMLTDEGDVVLDPFAGSCTTGEVCEKLRRKWICIESREEYLVGAMGRFPPSYKNPAPWYRIAHPAMLWEYRPENALFPEEPLDPDGGRKR